MTFDLTVQILTILNFRLLSYPFSPGAIHATFQRIRTVWRIFYY
jgi:hypothetical protein